MKHATILVAVSLALSAVGALRGEAPANLAEPSSSGPTALPAVVVTATQAPADPFDVPFSSTALTSADFERQLPRTLPNALQELPGVMVQKTAYGQGSPYVRGFTGFRTLMLVDGIRLNNSVFRDGPNQYWNTIDPLSLERLEIVKGPSSVLFGSDAIGGTVNALTLGRLEFGSGFDWDARTFYRYATAENSHTGRAEVSANVDRALGFHLGGSWKEFGDLEGGRDVGRQARTGYHERDLDAKVEYRLSDDAKLVFAHQTVGQDDAWRTHATIYGLSWEGVRPGSDRARILDQDRHLSYAQLQAVNLSGFAEEVHASLSHHLQREAQWRVRSDRRRELTGFDVHTLGLSLQLQSPSPVGRWVYGGEYYRDWVDSFSVRYRADGSLERRLVQGPVGDEASYDLAGVYVQNQLPALGPVELLIGGRYNFAAAEAQRVQDPRTGQRIALTDDWQALVGSARALVRLDSREHWHFFTGVSQGFRAPNLSDLSRFDLAEGGEIETPAPGLEPEFFVSYEAGLKTRYARGTAEAAYFYTTIEDLIIRTPTGRVVEGLNEVTKRNSGDGFLHGVELSGSLNVHPRLALHGAFTWMEGEVTTYPTSSALVTRKEPTSRLMPATGRIGLLWEAPERRGWVEGLCLLAARADQLSAADRRDTQRIPPAGTPDYTVYTLRGGWRPKENFTVSIALENLTDEDCRIHGSGLNEPGRNFVVALELRW
jgi:hemoglobin/transferrin/lactoferrin receptor protein